MTETPTPTPDEAFEALMDGNRRFVAGAPEHPNQDAARRAETVPAQRPFAALFGCSDSRLAAEIIFDRGWATCSWCARPGTWSARRCWAASSTGRACWTARWSWSWAMTRAGP